MYIWNSTRAPDESAAKASEKAIGWTAQPVLIASARKSDGI